MSSTVYPTEVAQPPDKRRLRPTPQMKVGAAMVITFVVLALVGPFLVPYEYNEGIPAASWESPSAEHWLGTDSLGRDVLSRVVQGSRISLAVGAGSMGIALLIGMVVGLTAGYRGGAVDALLTQVVNIVLAFPALLLMILFAVVLGSGVASMVLAIGLTQWAPLARLVRAETLRARQLDYVKSARAIGANTWRIITRHVLPSSFGPIVVFISFGIPLAIMAEAGLGFIGLGVQPPTPSWGVLLNDGFGSFRSFPHLVLAPALALSFTMTGFVLFGNGLRDALDPRVARR